jgi:hypothetical protein
MSQHEIDMCDEGRLYQNSFKMLEAIYADTFATKITKQWQEDECNTNEAWHT